MKHLLSIVFSLTALIALLPNAAAQTRHIIHFEDTDHELHVYEIKGEEPGKTMLIIGGMHNEPGGYVTADLYADITLKKGNLIVVPRANMPAIVNNKRGINNDMNRTFTDKSHDESHKHIYEDDIVSVLKQLIAKSDVLLNLHDGYGYYRPEYVSDLANPKRWGQAIITDREIFTTKTGEQLHLAERAKAIVEAVNPLVENQFHRFHYKDTRTKAVDSIHKEQRTSATFYALYEHGIEAYGVETSKNIRSLDLKVSYQSMIVNAFLNAFDIVPEKHNLHLDSPQLSYLLLSINGARPQAYRDGESLMVRPGDEVTIVEAFTNYKRGVVVDLEQNHALNDLGKSFVMEQPTSIRVLKDQYLAGRVFIEVSDNQNSPLAENSSSATNQSFREPAHLLVEVNGKQQKVVHGGTISLSGNDTLKLLQYNGMGNRHKPSQINLVGFVGNTTTNDGEDTGYEITKHKLIKRFSIDGEGKRYRIKAEQGKLLIAQFFVSTDG